jgi:hypothetical protein
VQGPISIFSIYIRAFPMNFSAGVPYSSRPDYKGIKIKEAESRKVTFCLGLWKGDFFKIIPGSVYA